MTISAQPISACSPSILQPGMHHKSLVDSTEVIKQALSFFSSAEDASDAGVPAQDTSVRDFTGKPPTILPAMHALVFWAKCCLKLNFVKKSMDSMREA